MGARGVERGSGWGRHCSTGGACQPIAGTRVGDGAPWWRGVSAHLRFRSVNGLLRAGGRGEVAGGQLCRVCHGRCGAKGEQRGDGRHPSSGAE